MKKLEEWIDLLYEGKQKRGLYVSPSETWILELIYKGIVKEFVSLTVRNVLYKCGIPVKEKGIGWEVVA